MNVRFQADNDLDERIITATKRLEPAIDFIEHRRSDCTWEYPTIKYLPWLRKRAGFWSRMIERRCEITSSASSRNESRRG